MRSVQVLSPFKETDTGDPVFVGLQITEGNFIFLGNSTIPPGHLILDCQFSSVAQSCLTLCDSMETVAHQASLSITNCRSPPKPCPLSQWCHPTISSSVIPFFSSLQSFPASGSFPMSRLFTSGGQSTGASVSASVLLMNIQDWFPLGLTGLISLQFKGLSRVFSNTTVQKHQFFSVQPSYGPALTSIYDWVIGHRLCIFSALLDNVFESSCTNIHNKH